MALDEQTGPMPDGPVRRFIKAIARALYMSELTLRRRWLRARRQDHYRLAGACQRCAKCCETLRLSAPALVYRVRALRSLLVAWQWHVNRFALLSCDDEAETLSFRCAHFDRATRTCDSYASRPAMCRDYPRFLLDQAWPELFDECGYRAVSRNADALARALDAAELAPDVREKLKKRLHVVD